MRKVLVGLSIFIAGFAYADINVGLTKSCNKSGTVYPGDEVIFYLDWSVNGEGIAKNVRVWDTLPNWVEIIYIYPSGWSQNDNIIEWDKGDVTAGSNFNYNITVRIQDPGTVTDITNWGSISTTSNEVDLEELPDPPNGNPITLTIGQRSTDADLEITKTYSGSYEVNPGEYIDYTISYNNLYAGSATAENVVVTDHLPEQVEYVESSPSGSYNSVDHKVVWNRGDVGPGEGYSISLRVYVPGTTTGSTTLTNTVKITSDTYDPNDTNNSASCQNHVEALQTDLAITKSGPTEYEIGQLFTYQLTYQNVGANPADAEIIDQLPEEVEYNGSNPGGTYDSENHRVTWNITDIGVGVSDDISVFVVIKSTVPASTTFTNWATITASGDTNSANDVASCNVHAETPQGADLEITKTLTDPSEPMAGEWATYTISYKNNGPITAENVVIREVSSSGLTDITSNPELPLILSSLSEYAGGTIILCGRVNLSASDTVTNVVNITSDTYDPDLSNNTSTASYHVVAPVADLEIRKDTPNSQGEPGELNTYDIKIRNNGPGTARNVILYDYLPDNFLYIDSTPEADTHPAPETHGDGVVIWNVGDLSAHPGWQNFNLQIRVSVDAPSSATLINIASVTATMSTDDNEANNVATATFHVSGPDLWIDKSATGGYGVSGGDEIRFTLNYGNSGNLVANNVTVIDLLPNEFEYLSASPSPIENTPGVDYRTLKWDISSIGPGESDTIYIYTRVVVDTPASTTLTNTGSITSEHRETNLDNNIDSLTKHIVGADLYIEKSGPSEQEAETNFDYRIYYKNYGPGTATQGSITDTLPAEVSFIGASGDFDSYSQSGQDLTFYLPELANGQTGNIYITVTLGEYHGSTSFTNTANIHTANDQGDDDYQNQDSHTVHIPRPDVQIQKSYSGSYHKVRGEEFTYTIRYRNYGEGATAKGVVIEDSVPTEFVDIVNWSAGGLRTGNIITWNIGDLEHSSSWQEKQITVRVKDTAEGCTYFRNYATITCTNLPETDDDNTNYCTNHIAVPNVWVNKEDGEPHRIPPGVTFTYVIRYGNNGQGEVAEDVVLIDFLPDNVPLEDITPSDGGVYNPADNTVRWDLGDIPDEFSGQVSIQIRLGEDAVGGTYFENRATISCTNTPEEDDDDNEDTVHNHVAQPDVEVEKPRPDPEHMDPGTEFIYTIRYRNYNSTYYPDQMATATSVSLVDTLPTNVNLEILDADGGNVAGNLITWNIGTLPPSDIWQEKNVRVRLDSDAACTWFQNRAEISCANLGGEYYTGNNSDSCWNHIATTDLYVRKTAEPETNVFPGETIVYTITYGNEGQGTATNISITDFLSEHVDYVSCTGGGVHSEGIVTWGPFTLPAGTEETFQLEVTTHSDLPGSTSIINIVEITVDPREQDIDDNRDFHTNHIPPHNVWIEKTGPTETIPESVITYTLNYGNIGVAGAENVRVYDLLPDYVKVVSLSRGTDSQIGQLLQWNIGYLASGVSDTIRITAQLGPEILASSTITNIGSITADGVDADYDNNYSAFSTHIEGPDVYIEKTPDYQNLEIGEGGQFTLSYGNRADLATATNVVINDTFPFDMLEITSVSPATDTAPLGWNIGILYPGDSGNITIDFRVRDDAIASITVTNEAEITCDNECPEDQGNNNASAQVHIEGADVWIRKGMDETRFNLVTGRLKDSSNADIRVADTGKCHPVFVDIDGDSDLDLFIGDDGWEFYYYENTGSVEGYQFTHRETYYLDPNNLNESAPAFCDIDYDGDLDLFIGDDYDNFHFFENVGSSTFPDFEYRGSDWQELDDDVGDPQPAFCDIDADGDFDLFLGDWEDGIRFYRNNGSRYEPDMDPEGWLQDAGGNQIDIGNYHSVELIDFDSDGDFDLFIGDREYGLIYFYENTGTPQDYQFTYRTNYFAGIDVGDMSAPYFADIDADGDLDLFVGDGDGYIEHYENIGQELFQLAPIQYNIAYGNFGNAVAENVRVVDHLPEKFTYSHSEPSASVVGNILTWNMGDLAVNYVGVIRVYGTVTQETIGSTTLTNVATITTETPECDYYSNIATHTLHIGTPTPDLVIEKAGPPGYPPGLTLAYQLNFRNTSLVSGLLGEYFGNTSFSGEPQYLRTDLYLEYNEDRVDDDWEPYGADSNISVRWIGWIYAEQDGTYWFSAQANDSVSLYIDQSLVCTNSEGSEYLTQGYHPIEIRFYNGGGDQWVRVRWRKPGEAEYSQIPKEHLRSVDPEQINRGGEILDVDVFDLLPPASSITYTLANPAPANITGQLLEWSFANLYPGQYQIIIQATVAQIAASNTLINTSSATTTASELYTENNYATLSTHITEADLAIEKCIQSDPSFTLETKHFAGVTRSIGSDFGPGLADVDSDGDLDMFVGVWDGRIREFENVDGSWEDRGWADSDQGQIDLDGWAHAVFCDIDADGDPDLFTGAHNGYTWFYRNEGGNWIEERELRDEDGDRIRPHESTTPGFCDMDGDSDYDLFIADHDGRLYLWENTGSPEVYKFEERGQVRDSEGNYIDVSNWAVPAFCDIDRDGDYDMFIGAGYDSQDRLNFFRNTGTIDNPIWKHETDSYIQSYPAHTAPSFADIDADGDYDLFLGVCPDRAGDDGGVWFFRCEYGEPTAFTGQTVRYTIKYSNPSGATIEGVQVYDWFEPAWAEFAEATPAPADIGPPIRWDIGTLEPGDKGAITLIATVSLTAVSSQTLTNFASITSTIPEYDYSNNTGSASAHITGPDLAIYKMAEKEPVWEFVTENYEPFDVEYKSAIAFCDIDADGDYDLFAGDDHYHFWFYENIGTPEDPEFVERTNQYLPHNPREAGPGFCDIDSDGDYDLFMGEDGGNRTHFFRNDGTPKSPSWTHVTSDYFADFGISRTTDDGRVYFADIDADEDFDMFIGEWHGRVRFYLNTGNRYDPDWEDRGWLRDSTDSQIDVGYMSDPCLVDIDSDGDLDLFIGEWNAGNERGAINFYENTGTVHEPIWTRRTERYNGIEIRYYGASPFFVDIDSDGDLDLFCGDHEDGELWFWRNIMQHTSSAPIGSEIGYLLRYKNKSAGWAGDVEVQDLLPEDFVFIASTPTQTSTQTVGSKTLITWQLGTLRANQEGSIVVVAKAGGVGSATVINIATITSITYETNTANNIGTWSHHIEGPDLSIVKMAEGDPVWSNATFITEPANESTPALCDIDGDGDLDLFIGFANRRVYFYRNQGEGAHPPDWQLESTDYNNMSYGGGDNNAAVTFCDIDADGDYDMFLRGPYPDTTIYFYENTGNANEASWASPQPIYGNFYVRTLGFCFADIDSDGDYDFFAAQWSDPNHIYFYENTGTPEEARWAEADTHYGGITLDRNGCGIDLCDIDSDGDLDMFVVDGKWSDDHYADIWFFRNVGTKEEAEWKLVTKKYNSISFEKTSPIAFGDIDGDYDYDLVVGSAYDGTHYYTNERERSSSAPIGSEFSYLLKYKNQSQTSASSVNVYDFLPQEFILLAATPTYSSTQTVGNNTLITWQLGEIAAGKEDNIVLKCKVADTVIASTTLVNHCTITTTTPEEDTTNNTSTWTTHITPPILDVVIEKRVYRPGGLLAEYFNNENLQGEPALTRIDPTIDFNWRDDSPADEVNSDNFSVRWTGLIYIPVDGWYEFTNRHHDGFYDYTNEGMRLSIDGTIIFDEYWNDGDDEKHEGLNLTQGWHTIRVEFREKSGNARAYLFTRGADRWDWGAIPAERLYYPVDAPDIQPGEKVLYKVDYANGTLTYGLLGEYFNNENLSGDPVLTRIDPTIDFNWRDGSPDPSINSDHFSVRWTGYLYIPVDGWYEFTNRHHDGFYDYTNEGMRLIIDGETIFDEYWDDDNDERHVGLNLTQGWHTVKIEFREDDGNARAYLFTIGADRWDWGAIPPERLLPAMDLEDAENVEMIDLLPEEIEIATVTTPPTDITQESGYTRLTWNIGELPQCTRDSVIIVGTVSPELSASLTLTNYASITTTELERSKENNISSATIHIEPELDLALKKCLYKQGGLYAEYFNNENLQGTPTLTRVDSTIDFDWEYDSPDPSINSDYFSVRWTGLLYISSAGWHEFSNRQHGAESDYTNDGMRLSIDGTIIFDEYWDDGNLEKRESVELTEGWHTIRVEFRERTGNARAFLYWRGESNSWIWEPISSDNLYYPVESEDVAAGDSLIYVIEYGENGLLAEYFNNENLQGEPALTRIDPTIDFNWRDDSPDSSINSNHFSVRWTGLLYIPVTGWYEFTNRHHDGFDDYTNDGMRLSIDGTIIFDEYWNDGNDEKHESVYLTEGWHTIRVEFRENEGNARAYLFTRGADRWDWGAIPPERLLPVALPEGVLPDNVVVIDNLPPEVEYQSAYPTPSTETPYIAWDAEDPLKGWMLIEAVVDSTLIGSTTFTNYASITATSQETDYTNNIATCTLHILGPDIWVEKFAEEPLSIDLDDYAIISYGGASQDQNPTQYEVIADGACLRMWGNNWKAIEHNVEIDESTVLTFYFKSEGAEGEIAGVGVEDDLSISSDRLFRVYGTQDWGISDYDNYPGSGWKYYEIPIGEHFTGSFDYITFVNDADAGQETNVYFKDIRIGHPVSQDTESDGLPGGSVTYYIRYANYSPITAPNVVVGDYLPNEIVDAQFDPTPSGDISAGTATLYYWNLGTLAEGDYGTITITGTISDTIYGSVTINNVATVTSAGGFQYEENTSSSWKIHIPAPELYIYKFQKKEPEFTLRTMSYENIDVGEEAVCQFADIDGDGDLDIIADGDNSSSDPDMFYYRNDRDPGSPSWTMVTDDYVEYSGGVIIEEANDAHCFVDIDADGDLDLFCGDGSGGYIEFYRNDGDYKEPVWVLVDDQYINVNQTNLAPTFCDIDADGDFDLFCGKTVGNNGRIEFFRNIGDAQNPDFTGVGQDHIENYAGIDVERNAVPFFCDIDGDFDYDLIVGDQESGELKLWRNIGTLQTPDWQEEGVFISFGANEAHPVLCDIDADGDYDLFIGMNNGQIAYYENTTSKEGDEIGPGTELIYHIRYGNNSKCKARDVKVYDLLPSGVTFGSATPTPSTITGQLLEWDVGDLDIREEGTITITVTIGSLPDSSTLINYATITYPGCERYGTNNTGSWTNHVVSMDLSIKKSIRPHPFTYITDEYLRIDVGAYSTPAGFDLDLDGDCDVVIGAGDGNVWFFRNEGGSFTQTEILSTGESRAHPCFADADGDGNVDLLIGYNTGEVKVYECTDWNTPFSASSWSDSGNLSMANGAIIDVGNNAAPEAVDIDGDLDLDLLIGNNYGRIWYFENEGEGDWNLKDPSYEYILSPQNAAPAFFDVDMDGDSDLFCGKRDGTIDFYENYGNAASADFDPSNKIENWAGLDVGENSAPAFCDVDSDGDRDLLVGRADGRMTYLRNEGSYGSHTVKDKRIAYILECKKEGSLEAEDVVVEDLMPDLIVFETYTVRPDIAHSFTQSNSLLTWDFGDFGSEEYSWKITIIGSVTGPATSNVTNVATITTTSSDIDQSNNYSSVESHIIEITPDLWIEKCDANWPYGPPSEVPPGAKYIEYKLYYGNRGLLTAQDVVIYDLLPTRTTYILASPVPKGTETVIIDGEETVKLWWKTESIESMSGTYTITVKVKTEENLATGTVLLNTASVTTTQSEMDKTNNISTWTTVVKVPVIDLVIDKTGPSDLCGGDIFVYTLEFCNDGTATLGSGTVKMFDYYKQDKSENRLSLISIEDEDNIVVSYTDQASLLTIILGTETGFAPGEKYSIDLRFQLSENAIIGDEIINVSSITYTGDIATETYLFNNYDTFITKIGTPTIKLRIFGLTMWDPGISGYEREYVFLIYNEGNRETGATITVTLPPELKYVETRTTRIGTETEHTYLIGPYYDPESHTVSWIINPEREPPGDYNEINRYTIGHYDEDAKEFVGLGAPLRWIELKKRYFASQVKSEYIADIGIPFYTLNTMVGTVTGTKTVQIVAEIEPWPMTESAEMETTGDTCVITDVLKESIFLSISSSNDKMEVRALPEGYTRDCETIFYIVRFDRKSSLYPSICAEVVELDENLHSFYWGPGMINGRWFWPEIDRNRAVCYYNGTVSEGYFLFWAKAAEGLTEGVKIQNVVRVSVDEDYFGNPIWNYGTITHYIDRTPPSCGIEEITLGSDNKLIITWSGKDPDLGFCPERKSIISGSGIDRYKLYVKEEDGDWEEYGVYRASTQTTFSAKERIKYSFYIEAVDRARNRSASEEKSYTLIITNFAERLGDVIVWPNPYKAHQHRAYGIRFGDKHARYGAERNLTRGYILIRIYNIAGELVERIEVTEDLNENGEFCWKNPEDSLASGVYIYLITNPAGEKCIGKLAIIK